MRVILLMALQYQDLLLTAVRRVDSAAVAK
jgi:hypothetical protein